MTSKFSILHSASLCAVLKISHSLYSKRVRVFENKTLRDWSKSIGRGGPEQRGGGSSVFEPLVKGGSCNF